MKISRIGGSKLEARIRFDTPAEYERAYPNRLSLAARKVLQAAHIVKPLEYPIERVFSIDTMQRQDAKMIEHVYDTDTLTPEGLAVQAEILGLHDQLEAGLKAVQEANRQADW